jgi:hypothetical protein
MKEGSNLSMYDDGQQTQNLGNYPPMPPQYMMPPYGYRQGYGLGYRLRRQYPIETKPFFLTSEFALSLIASILIAITAASSHAFGAWRAWILIAAIVCAYNLSRGIAKSGTRSNASDPREDLDLHWGRSETADDQKMVRD